MVFKILKKSKIIYIIL